MQHEPLRLHKAWGTATLVFLLWDGAILAAAWWALGRWGGEALQVHKVRQRVMGFLEPFSL